MSRTIDQIKKLGYFEAGDSFIEGELVELHKWNKYSLFRTFEIILDDNDWNYKIYALDLDAVKRYITDKFIINDELSFRVYEVTRTKVLDFEMGKYHNLKGK